MLPLGRMICMNNTERYPRYNGMLKKGSYIGYIIESYLSLKTNTDAYVNMLTKIMKGFTRICQY